MKLSLTCVILTLLLAAGTASAQWFQTTYALKGGWNAIYLHGDATHAVPDTLFPNSGATAGVEEVWRWNPNPTQIQFTASPLVPNAGTPEWSVWKRGLPLQSNLSLMTGQTAYLVKCTGTVLTSHNVPIVQKALPPSATWVRSGANLLGFPSKLNVSVYPSFGTYFQTFPIATAASSKIYKYVGGDLGPANPMQVFSPSTEPLDRNKAYWFEAEVVGNFFAPLDISLSTASGLDFGRSGSVIKARVRNTTAASMTLTLTPVTSIAAPAGQDAVTGPVPLMRRTFNSIAATWTETAITAPYDEVIPPQSTVELNFGINRATMTGPSNALYASLLRLTDSGNLFDISLPASARVSSLAGLWVGEASVTNVSSQVVTTAAAKATVKDGVVTGIEITGGGFGYGSVPVPVIAPPNGVQAAAAAAISDGAVTALTITNPGSGYVIAPNVTLSSPITGTTATATATVSRGAITGFAITTAGTGYTAPPVVTIGSPQVQAVQAVATSTIAGGAVTSVAVTNPGAAYFTAPAVTVAPPVAGQSAIAVAMVAGGIVTGITVTSPGSGYTAPPAITIGAPPGRTTATASVVVQNGTVTTIRVDNGGSGYLDAPAITFPTPVPPGTATARPLPLRVLLHIDDAGTARVLSQVFLGKLDTGTFGLCTRESRLKQSDKASAARFFAAHLPLDRVLAGSVPAAIGSTVVHSVNIPFDDGTNPFVHTFHPDHNNRDARGNPLGAGVESYGIIRTLSFQFTTTPPSGSSATGWGSTTIGGNYTDVLKGLHKNSLTLTGTFELRRASELGTLITN
jgi:hypothetical protein